MEENKIPTLFEMLTPAYNDTYGKLDPTKTMELVIEFTKMHVSKALEAAKQVNPQCMWDDSEDCYVAIQNEYGIEKCYLLENIK